MLAHIARPRGPRFSDFQGLDVCHAFEFSWLNTQGQPKIALLQLSLNAKSPVSIAPRGLKHYLNAFSMQKFESPDHLQRHLSLQLAEHFEPAHFEVLLIGPQQFKNYSLGWPGGQNLDALDLDCSQYQIDASLLSRQADAWSGRLSSKMMRFLCLETGQPYWACLSLDAESSNLDPASFMRYLVSYRQSRILAEHCIEQILIDLQRVITFTGALSLRLVRRGGISQDFYRAHGTLETNPQQRAPYQ